MEEIWKDINGFNGRYSVSNYGRIKQNNGSYISKQNHIIKYYEKILEPGIWQSRYLRIDIQDKHLNKRLSTYVHKLVAEYFIGERPAGYQIDHIDGNYLNNRSDNLRYTTPSTNMNNINTKNKISTALKQYWNNISDNDKQNHSNRTVEGMRNNNAAILISTANKGRIPITNGTDLKRIKPDQLDYYLNKGYWRGLPKKTCDKLKAHHHNG